MGLNYEPSSLNQVERFVSLYTGSKWGGTVVRVEVAKDHFQAWRVQGYLTYKNMHPSRILPQAYT